MRATDAENDALLYTLSGSSDFAIGRTNGQIRVADRVEFDYEGGQRSYTVLVKADDGFAGGTGTVDVTITITDVNEPPVVEDDTATTNEDEAVVINVLSDDRDPETANADLTVSVSRPQNGGATLDASRQGGHLHAQSQLSRRRHLHLHGLRWQPLRPGDGLRVGATR